MDFANCYDLSDYMDKINRGKFTEREIALGAFEIYTALVNCNESCSINPIVCKLIHTLGNIDDSESNIWLKAILDELSPLTAEQVYVVLKGASE